MPRSRWLGIITFGWGVMMTLHGITHNFRGILSVRLIMGAFEAGFFPGAIAYMTKWYTNYELATRLSIFYVGSALSGAFSGLLAYAIAKMNGVGGLEGWRWIFILEGLVTVAVGVLIPFLLTDTPDNRPSWLTAEETDYLIERMKAQNAGQTAEEAGSHLSKSMLWTVITDWQLYPLAIVQWSNTVPTYGLKFTLPQIIKNMGYTSSHAQLLSVPPYIAGAISSIAFSLLSDKFRKRSYFLVIPQTLLVIAYSVLTPLSPRSKQNIGACYFAIVLANVGCYPINPGTSSWCANNTAPSGKRSISIAYLISLSSVGGIFASYIYIDSEAPGYPTGFGTSLAFAAAGIFAVIGLDITYARINKRRSRTMEQVDIREKYTEAELTALGDRSPLFRYTL
ncbi:hypothetical protein LTR51_001866 [Lithohypha guttulata]|nr:hypothetical protein LTR51_001866 [Lithohypha guttulata]